MEIDDSPQGNNGADTQAERTQGHLPWIVNNRGRSRYFCPVPGCLHGDTIQAKGWTDLQGVRTHLREHYAGRFSGAVPQLFLDAHKLCTCSVCGKIISQRSNGCCPSCRPVRRATVSRGPIETSVVAGLPSLDDVCTTRVRLLKYIPRSARAVWGQVLSQTTANVVWHNSLQAWTELAMLPKCVLLAPPRQGKSNKSDTVAFIKLRCQRWLDGERMELWVDGPGTRKRHQNSRGSTPSNRHTIEHQQQRCMELVADGQYAKATKALISPGPLRRNEEIEKAMREKHPLAQGAPDLSDLAAPGRTQVPEFDGALVRKMLK